MSLRSKEVRRVNKLRLWWNVHWSDVLSALSLLLVLIVVFDGLSVVAVLLFRSGNLWLQALALLILLAEWAGVLYGVMKD